MRRAHPARRSRQHYGDLFEGHAFVTVKVNDDSLGLGQSIECRPHRVHGVAVGLLLYTVRSPDGDVTVGLTICDAKQNGTTRAGESCRAISLWSGVRSYGLPLVAEQPAKIPR